MSRAKLLLAMPLINMSARGCPVLIRPATPGDLPALAAAADAIFRTPPRPGLGSMGRELPAAVRRRQRRQPAAGAWNRAGGIVAHAGFTLRPAVLRGQPARVACFGAVFTAADQRGRGLATRVFQAAVDRARAGGRRAGAGLGGARAVPARRASSPTPCAGATGWPAGRRRRQPVVAGRPTRPAAARRSDRAPARRRADAVRSARAAEWQALAGAGVVFHHPGRLFAGRAGSGRPRRWPTWRWPRRRRRSATGGRGCWSWRGIGGPSPTPRPQLAPDAGPARHRPDLAAPRRLAGRRWPASAAGPPTWPPRLSCMFQRWNPALHSFPCRFTAWIMCRVRAQVQNAAGE